MVDVDRDADPALPRGHGAGKIRGPGIGAAGAGDAFAEAFCRIGGVDALVAWIEASDDHLKLFYAQLYPKLLALRPPPPPPPPITRIELIAG